MRYVQSQARREFDAWHKNGLILVRAAGKHARQNPIVRDSLLCASLFLTHARFENFFKDVVSFAVTRLNGSRLFCKALPGRLRAAHLCSKIPHKALKRYYIHNDETELLDDLHEALCREDWTWGLALHNGELNAATIISSNGYPSSDNLKKVFYKLGIKIFDECSRKMRTDVKALIDEIGELRCTMAHSGLPQIITDKDIERKIKELGRTVATIDRVVQERFNNPGNTSRIRKPRVI